MTPIQKQKRKLAREVFSNGPKWGLGSAIWGRHGPSKDFSRGTKKEREEKQNLAIQLWRAERRFRLGSRASILDTFEICSQQDWPFPGWLIEHLMERHRQALFEQTAFKQEFGRTRQSEITRIQRQKHFQMIWAIQNWRKLSPEGFSSNHPIYLASHPRELRGVNQRRFETADTAFARANLASDILIQTGPELRSNSAQAIEKSVQAISEEVEAVFGGSLGADLMPEYFLWDVPFLRAETLELIKHL